MTDLPDLPATIWLSREDRRALARRDRQPGRAPRRNRVCLFCLGPLSNGAAVCSEACDEGYWRLVPTIDGELWM